MGGGREKVPPCAAPSLCPATPEQAADEAADRDAIAAEPLLPDPGTPERDRVDSRQRATVGGLLKEEEKFNYLYSCNDILEGIVRTQGAQIAKLETRLSKVEAELGGTRQSPPA